MSPLDKSRLFHLSLALVFLATSSLIAFSSRARSRNTLFALMAPLVWAWLILMFLSVIFAAFETFMTRYNHPPKIALAQLWGTQFLNMGVFAGSVCALLVAPLAALPVPLRKRMAVALALLVLVLLFADTLHMRFVFQPVTLWAVGEAPQLLHYGHGVKAYFTARDAWFLVALVPIVAFAGWYRTPAAMSRSRPRARFWKPLLLLGLWGLAGAPAAAALWSDFHEAVRGPVPILGLTNMLARRGVLYTHLLDGIYSWGGRRPRHLPLGPADAIQAYFAKRPRVAPTTPVPYGAGRGMNVLIIQVESLQGWVIRKTIDGQEVTPFLNRLSRRGLYYPNFFDQTAGGRSSDADFMVMNSLYPLNLGAVTYVRPDNKFVALPQILASAGYRTFVAQSSPEGEVWNYDRIYPAFGFHQIVFSKDVGMPGLERWDMADDAIWLTRLVPRLSQLPQPFFAFVVTFGPHSPYEAPPERRELTIGPLETTLVGRYIHATHYLDRCLGQWFPSLERAGLLERTIVLIFGDHDAGLPLRDETAKAMGYVEHDPSALVRADRVPFILLIPGLSLQGEVPAVGGHIDVGPTLLYLLGIEPPTSFLGKVLLPGVDGQVVLPTPWGSAVTSDRLYLAASDALSLNGSCFSFPSGAPRPWQDCQALARHARRELEISGIVTLYDLARDIR